MPTVRVVKSFGDEFKDSFPFIDGSSQDILNLVSNDEKIDHLNVEVIQTNEVKPTSHEQIDEKIFRDLIRNYNPPSAIKVNGQRRRSV